MVKWIRKIFGIENLNKKVEDVVRDLHLINENVNLNSKETNQNISLLKSDLKKNQQSELIENFDLFDPISNKNFFEFKKIKFSTGKKELLDEKPSRILQAIGSIPEFLTGGLLSQSFSFKFPKGISGEVMNIAQGKGTAILSNGKIISHGAYVSNLLTSAPLIAYSAVNFVIKQHYLSKINKNLDEINEKLFYLINIEFIKKEAKIESIINFFQRCNENFSIIDSNENYKNALLSNIIANNNLIFELIYFYMKSISSSSLKNPEELNNNLNYFFLLKELFIAGKLLEFKYANEYNSTLVKNLKGDFDSTEKLYNDFLNTNKSSIQEISHKIDFNFWDKKWVLGNLLGSKLEKETNLDLLSKSDNVIDNYLKNSNFRNEDIKMTLTNFINNLEKPQSFIIENGQLYKTHEI